MANPAADFNSLMPNINFDDITDWIRRQQQPAPVPLRRREDGIVVPDNGPAAPVAAPVAPAAPAAAANAGRVWDGTSTPLADAAARLNFTPAQIAAERARITGSPASSPLEPTMQLGTVPITSPLSPYDQREAASLRQRTPGSQTFDPLAAARAASDQALSILPRRSTYGYAGLNPNEISLENLPHAAAIQQEIYRNLLPSDMQTRLGFGRLNLDTARELGGNGVMGQMQLNQNREMGYIAPNGTFVPGTNQMAAQRTATEHSPEGLEAQRRQQLRMKYVDQGMPQVMIDEALRALPPMSGNGPPITNYMGGGFGGFNGNQGGNTTPISGNGQTLRFGPGGSITDSAGNSYVEQGGRFAPVGGNTTTTNTTNSTPANSRIAGALARATLDFQGPPNAHGHRGPAQIPRYDATSAGPIHDAITNYFATFTPEELRNNYTEISTAAQRQFGPTAMTGWQQTTIPSFNATAQQKMHGEQRARVVANQGGRVTRRLFGLDNFLGIPFGQSSP